MDAIDIKTLTLEAIKNYHSTLRSKGVVDNDSLYKLLILSFVEEMLISQNSWFLTYEDYSVLSSILECTSKSSCLIPYTKIAIHKEPIKNFLEDTPIRISEGEVIKLSEADILRLVNI